MIPRLFASKSYVDDEFLKSLQLRNLRKHESP
jgi:hypothetical protein